MAARKPTLQTALLHADDNYRVTAAVAPDISVTTTFKHPVPQEDTDDQDSFDPYEPTRHLYSRYTQGVSTRVEKLLGRICNGFALTYASGLAAGYAALVHYSPARVAIRGGYHGMHMGIQVYSKTAKSVSVIDLDDEYKEGDLIWLETPLNPTGEARNIRYYVEKAHKLGCKVVVDSTFAPPPLQDPFVQGADCVLHSGTKYFGGHSDLLCGVLVAQSQDEWLQLWHNRTYMGNMMGSLESWLLLRSLRTLPQRVLTQAKTATSLAVWLDRVSKIPAGQEWDGVQGGLIDKVWHATLQTEDWIKEQMPGGGPACFGMMLHKPHHARMLPHALEYFMVATSLGGVESLIEQRIVSDPGADPRLVRLSIGLEDLDDLKADFRRALKEITKVAKL